MNRLITRLGISSCVFALLGTAGIASGQGSHRVSAVTNSSSYYRVAVGGAPARDHSVTYLRSLDSCRRADPRPAATYQTTYTEPRNYVYQERPRTTYRTFTRAEPLIRSRLAA